MVPSLLRLYAVAVRGGGEEGEGGAGGGESGVLAVMDFYRELSGGCMYQSHVHIWSEVLGLRFRLAELWRRRMVASHWWDLLGVRCQLTSPVVSNGGAS